MARSFARRIGCAARIFGCGLILTSGAAAEMPAASAPPLSVQCDVPSAEIAAPAPLANLAGVLEKRRTVNILAIGSSASYGLGAASGVKTYPAQLTRILETALKGVDVSIVNRSVAGEVAETTADRIKSEVAVARPDLVLWQLGTNDALARVEPDDFATTVRDTIHWLKDADIDVILVGLQYTARFAKDASYFAIRDKLRTIAAEENVLYIRRYDAMQFIAQTRANQPMMSADNFHMNDLGYQCMAEHVAHAVIANLFVKRFRPVGN